MESEFEAKGGVFLKGFGGVSMGMTEEKLEIRFVKSLESVVW